MGNSIFLMLMLQAALIFFNAVFACAEIAVISMNDAKLAKMASGGDRRAMRLSRLTGQPSRFLATIQVAITLSGFLGSAFAAENFSGEIAGWLAGTGVPLSADALNSIVVVLITLVLSYITLIFGELVPKQIAMRNSEKLALGMSGFISGAAALFGPLVSLLTASTNGVLRLMHIDPRPRDEDVGEEDIRMMVDVGNENGTIDNDEREFIQNVFEFDNTTVDGLITHRTDVTMLDMEDPMEVWEKTILDTRFTYYPVCDGTPDKIVGVLNTKEYFRLGDTSRDSVMKNAVVPAYFVPETLKADVLFQNMRKKRAHFAVVLDEYGGMSGIITIKDLIEELVGSLDDLDEEDAPEDAIEQLSEGVWKVGGGVMLEDLSRALDLPLPCENEDYDTLNGLIFHSLGSLPAPQEEIEIAGLKIRVTETEDYQVKTAIVRRERPAGQGG